MRNHQALQPPHNLFYATPTPRPVAADLLNRIHDDTGGDEIAARADLWLKLKRSFNRGCTRVDHGWRGESIERLSAQAPQRVCTRTFSLGDVIWKCRTCQVGDETCVDVPGVLPGW